MHKRLQEHLKVKTERLDHTFHIDIHLRNCILFLGKRRKEGPFRIIYLVFNFPLPKAVYQQHQFSSVAQLCPTLCNYMDCSTPGLPVHHQLPETAQTHIHQVGDTIQQFHPLLSPSLPAFNLSQHHGLFQWISSLHQVVKVLEFQLQHQSFQEYSGLISLRID